MAALFSKHRVPGYRGAFQNPHPSATRRMARLPLFCRWSIPGISHARVTLARYLPEGEIKAIRLGTPAPRMHRIVVALALSPTHRLAHKHSWSACTETINTTAARNRARFKKRRETENSGKILVAPFASTTTTTRPTQLQRRHSSHYHHRLHGHQGSVGGSTLLFTTRFEPPHE